MLQIAYIIAPRFRTRTRELTTNLAIRTPQLFI
jgi:hypothetical protein